MAEDVRLNAAELLAELDWLGRLARSLVGNVGAEQDLVQQTWLAASEVQGGVSRPWLVNTLRRLAARWHRTESRLRGREQAVARPEAVDTASLLERNELFGTVLEELRRIEEPYRTTLILLYQEGLTVRESAERLGVREDTLRWRHREGLELLRGRLDRRAPSDWRACLLPLLGGPAMDLPQGGVAAATTVSTSTVIGGSLMSLKFASLVVLAAVVVPVVFWNLGGGPEQPTGSVAGPPSPSQPLEAPRLAGNAPADGGRRELEAAPSGAEVLAISPPPVSGRTLAVSVIDARDEPISGARVWIGDSPDPTDAVWESNSAGIARIPMPEVSSTIISGDTETLYGQVPILTRQTGGEMQLRLLVDADLNVLVVDGRGEPVAGVPVALVRTKRLEATQTRTARDILGFNGEVETNGQGEALLRHVNHYLQIGRTANWWVGPAVLLAERSDVRLSLGDLPEEPVRLVLPPVAPLAVRVLDDTGAPNLDARQARVLVDPQPWRERDVPELVDEARFSDSGLVTVELVEGAGAIPLVGLGLQLLAEAREAEPTGSTFGLGPGPDTAGRRAELVLRPRDVALEIVGHARDAGGVPLANRELIGEIEFTHGRGGGAFRFDVTSDSSGRFRLFLDEEIRSRWAGQERRELHLILMGREPADVIGARCSLPDQLAFGANDVGEMILEPMTPLLAGAARTQEGEPVQIEYLWLVVNSLLEDRRVRFARDVRTVLAGDRFAIFGEGIELHPELGEVLELQLTSEGRPGRAQEVFEGALDLSFVFAEGGHLAGRVLLGPGQDFDDYLVQFRAPEQPGDYRSYQPVDLARNGSFTMEGLPRRTGDVEVRDWDTRTLLAIVPGIQPGPEPNTEDPRLAAIELGGSVDEYLLQVNDIEGEGIRTAEFESERLPQKRSSHGAGKFRWRAAGGSIVGTVSAPGFREQRVILNPGERTVVLEQGPEVVVRPVPSVELPVGARLVLLLVGGDSRERVQLSSLGDGSYSGFVSGNGKYQVRGRLTRRGVLLGELPLSAEPIPTIQISTSGARGPFEIPFDRDAFESRLPPE